MRIFGAPTWAPIYEIVPVNSLYFVILSTYTVVSVVGIFGTYVGIIHRPMNVLLFKSL